jgi:hypothetical protein
MGAWPKSDPQASGGDQPSTPFLSCAKVRRRAVQIKTTFASPLDSANIPGDDDYVEER